jgi:hypothetical protein
MSPISDDNMKLGFVGYGEADLYPELASYELDSLAYGTVRSQCSGVYVPSQDGAAQGVGIAQFDTIMSVFRGIHWDFRQRILAEALPRAVKAHGAVQKQLLFLKESEQEENVEIEDIDSESLHTFAMELRPHLEEAVDDLSEGFFGQLLMNLGQLSVVDLGNAARSLVEIEVLAAQKVDGEPTVAGLVEVATVDPRNGVSWRQRLST